MANTQELQELVHGEAKKHGVSTKQANKALDMIKKGKISMGSIAPQLKDMLTANLSGFDTSSPREKLKAKILSKRDQRKSKVARESQYKISQEQMKADAEKKKADDQAKKRREKERQRRHRKKLQELQEKLGTISFEKYRECMLRVQDATSYKGDDSELNRDKNIIELYHQQKAFSNKIALDDMDDLIESDEESPEKDQV